MNNNTENPYFQKLYIEQYRGLLQLHSRSISSFLAMLSQNMTRESSQPSVEQSSSSHSLEKAPIDDPELEKKTM